MIKNKFKKIISDDDQNFKNSLDELNNQIIKNSENIDKLTDKINKLEKENKKQNKIINSYNSLFNTIFLYYDLNPNSHLKNIQDLGYELLIFIDNICNKYDLQYWIDCGTLLGAIRHEDYIPWDDDLDGGMMRKDYNTFVEIFKDEIKLYNLKNLKFQFMKTTDENDNDIYSWIQIVYKHPDCEYTLMGIDIFPFDFIKDIKQDNFQQKFIDATNEFNEGMISKQSFDEILKKYYATLNLSMEKQSYYIPGTEGVRGPGRLYSLKFLETEKLFPLKKLNFGKTSIYAPNNHKYYLEKIYGPKFLEIPKIIRNHNRVSKLSTIENIDEILIDSINDLKNANKNFTSQF